MSGDERGEWWKICKKMGGRLGKRGAHFKREGGTRREGCNKQWGREERKESDETRRMRTAEKCRCRGSLRECAIYAGVWRGAQRGRKRSRWEGGHQRSVSACILSAPFWNIQRRNTYDGCVSELPANTMQDGSTCLAAYLTVREAHKWWTSLRRRRRGSSCTTRNAPAACSTVTHS